MSKVRAALLEAIKAANSKAVSRANKVNLKKCLKCTFFVLKYLMKQNIILKIDDDTIFLLKISGSEICTSSI